jgi:flagellar hook protein FlgE
MMDVVGNNIANVNTTGYKSSSAVFEDTLSQLMRSAGAPANGRGGVNPTQIGLGVQMGGISTNFTQGSAQNTGRVTDLMIQGDGFFVLNKGGEQVYSRAGAFTFDNSGRLVNNQGMVVQGWLATPAPATEDGTPGSGLVMNTNVAVTDIIIPANTVLAPAASTSVTMGGNISVGTTGVMTMGVTVYDGSGGAHALSIIVTPNEDGTEFEIDVREGEESVASSTGSLTFTETGALDEGSTAPEVTLADDTQIVFDISGITRFGGPSSLAITGADGYAAGNLQQFQIAPDGTITGIFSNDEQVVLAQVALANFNNPQGLDKAGNSTYNISANSGLPQIGTAGAGGRGTMLSSTLEMSNVDLAQEFTSLIVAQRGFQANSRVITTSDQMLEELVNIKR